VLSVITTRKDKANYEMGVLEASFQLLSGSEGEDKKRKKKGLERGVVIDRSMRAGQNQNCCWCWVKRAERGLCTGPVSVGWAAGSAADLLHPWLLGWVTPSPFCPAGVCSSSEERFSLC